MTAASERTLWLILGSLAAAVGVSSVTPSLATSAGAILVANVFLARVWGPALLKALEQSTIDGVTP